MEENKRINWNEPLFNEDDLAQIKEVLDVAYVNEGPKSKELEDKLKTYLGVKHIILTTNATAALFLAIKAESIIKGMSDFEVIVPDLTMFASATAVNWAGGKPVLVDVERERATIDINKIEEKITDKTIAIMPVHILGRSAEMDQIKNISKKYDLAIIEDAAGALGSKDKNNNYLGTIGKVGCFSLQSNKIISCGQGGIIATNDDRLNEIIRRLRDFGRFDKKEFLHSEIGFNLKFNDISAALTISQLNKLENRKILLKEQLRQYQSELLALNQIKFFNYNENEIPLWIDVIVEKRDELKNYLISKNIHSREEWPALHSNPPYKSQGNNENFPNSSFFSENVLWLPNGPAISSKQISFICEKIIEFYDKMELKKIHEDKRGFIYVVKSLLENDEEFSFLELKKGYARGGCYHSKDEFFVVIKGKIKVILDDKEKIFSQGESALIPAGVSHAFIGLEDSIVSEWGITTREKEKDVKNLELRVKIDEINCFN